MQICILIRKKQTGKPLFRFCLGNAVATRVQFLSFKNVTGEHYYMYTANDGNENTKAKIERNEWRVKLIGGR